MCVCVCVCVYLMHRNNDICILKVPGQRHIYIQMCVAETYIYINVCVCVCVCVYLRHRKTDIYTNVGVCVCVCVCVCVFKAPQQ